MNKNLLSVLMATTIMSAGVVMAQETPVPAPEATAAAVEVEKPKLPPRFDRKHHEQRAKKMAQDLNLTAEQQEQADKIRREGQEKIKPLMKEMKDLREKIDAERRANMEEFEKILTPEQKQKLDEIKQRGMEDFKRRIGERRGPKMCGPHHFEKLRPVPRHPEGEMLPPPPLPEDDVDMMVEEIVAVEE